MNTDDIQELEDYVYDAKEAFLLKCRWKHSCDNPASIWLWEKKIDKKTIAVNLDVAISIERRLEPL